VRIYDKRITQPQFVLQRPQEGEFMGFDWSRYCESLLATYSRSSDVVRFWNLYNPKSEDAKQKLLEGNLTKAKNKNRAEVQS